MRVAHESIAWVAVPGNHPADLAGPTSSCGLVHLRAARRPAGTPGSAVFPARTWKQIIGRLGLSQREGEIVRGVFEDRTEFAIAADLGISPHTVHTHFERLHRKLGVGDRVQLVLCITGEFLRLGSPSNGAQPFPGPAPGCARPTQVHFHRERQAA